MLIRVEVIVGGSDAAGPDPRKGPTLHACLTTAPVHDDNYCPGEILDVGRSDCSVTIDDKCVSKKHLSIRLLSNKEKIAADGVQLLEQAGRSLPGFGSPETPEERRACETSPTGIVCVVKDTSKFGTFVSPLSTESLGEVQLNADPREQENSGAESDTDDEGAPATLRSYIEPSEFQRAALDLFEKETDATSEEAPRFEMIEQNKPILLLHLSHSNAARPQVTILLGTKGSAIRLSLVPLHFALSQYKPADIIAPLHVLGASLSEHWNQRSTHLMAPSKTQSVETLLAVLSGKPIVTKEYASALLRRSSPEDPLPSEEDFRPRGGGVAIECDDISKLRISLKGYRIAVMADDAVAQLAQEAGAAVLRIPEEAPRSQEEFEEWLQGELERATAEKQVVAVVDSNDESYQGFRASFANAGTRFASPETLASAVMGDGFLDVAGRAIEKIEGWKDVEVGLNGQDNAANAHTALEDSFVEVGFVTLVIQGLAAKLHQATEPDSGASKLGEEIVSWTGGILDKLENFVPHLNQNGDAIAGLRRECVGGAEDVLSGRGDLDLDLAQPAQTDGALRDALMFVAYNAHISLRHSVQLPYKGVGDDEILARTEAIGKRCHGIIQKLHHCAPHITEQAIAEIISEANGYFEEWSDSNKFGRGRPPPVAATREGKVKETSNTAAPGDSSDSNEDAPKPTKRKKKRGKPKAQKEKHQPDENRKEAKDDDADTDTFDAESFFNEQQESLRELTQAFKSVGENELVAADTMLLRVVELQCERAFDSSDPNLARLCEIAKNFMVILAPLSKTNQMLVKLLKNDSIDFSAAETSIAAILTRLEELDEDNTAGNTVVEATAYLDKVKAAIAKRDEKNANNGDGSDDSNDSNDSEEEASPNEAKKGRAKNDKKGVKETSKTTVKKFVALKDPTRNLMTHTLSNHVIYKVCCKLTVHQLFGKFAGDTKSQGYINRAKDFSRSVDPEFDFNESTTVIVFMEELIRPGFEIEDQEQAALEMICDFKQNLTQTSGKPRRDVILPVYAGAELYSVSGEKVEGVEAFFSGPDDMHTNRRRKAVNVFINLWLSDQIQKNLPEDLVYERSFIQSILCNSATNVEKNCNLANRKFFEKPHRKNSTIVKKLSDNILSIKDEIYDGTRTVLIENDEQLKSYKQLLE